MADVGEAAPAAPKEEEDVTPRRTLEPKLRLFLSADVVGSTAYKQRGDGIGGADGMGSTAYRHRDVAVGGSWFSMISSFYSQAGALLRSQWDWFESSLDECDQPELLGQAPELWKTIGDEVLFAKELSNPSQAVMTLHVWMETLKGLRKVLQKFHPALDVKSTAWIADFPIRNREIVLGAKSDPEDDQDWMNDQLMQSYAAGTPNLICDYIGPSIDTGFRLGAAATPRQLAVSVELAHILSFEECQPRTKYMIGPAQIPPLQFRYDGKQPLKGVLNGASYPQLWIDTDPNGALNKAEDAILRRAEPSAEDIHAFTSAFVEQHANKFCTGLPFVRPPLPEAYQTHCEAIQQQIHDCELRFRRVETTRAARLESVEKPEAAPAQADLDVALDFLDEPMPSSSAVSAE